MENNFIVSVPQKMQKTVCDAIPAAQNPIKQ
jgi:hypothetical protein